MINNRIKNYAITWRRVFGFVESYQQSLGLQHSRWYDEGVRTNFRGHHVDRDKAHKAIPAISYRHVCYPAIQAILF